MLLVIGVRSSRSTARPPRASKVAREIRPLLYSPSPLGSMARPSAWSTSRGRGDPHDVQAAPQSRRHSSTKTESTVPARTHNLADASRQPPADPMIVTEPGRRPTTSPRASTVAILVSALIQRTTRTGSGSTRPTVSVPSSVNRVGTSVLTVSLRRRMATEAMLGRGATVDQYSRGAIGVSPIRTE